MVLMKGKVRSAESEEEVAKSSRFGKGVSTLCVVPLSVGRKEVRQMGILDQAASGVAEVKRSEGGSKAYIAFERDDNEQHGVIVDALERAAADHSIKRNPLGIRMIALGLTEAGYLEQDGEGGFQRPEEIDDEDVEPAQEF